MDEIDPDEFLRRLAATPAGRAHLLSLSVAAEEGDERGLFDRLAAAVAPVDERLRTAVLRHRDDETRHARLFRECLERAGLEEQPIPRQLRIVAAIAERTGAIAGAPDAPVDVVEDCALLHVIEQRGVERFPHIADAFRAVAPDIADVYVRVTRDERRHVRSSAQIGRRFAASDERWRLAVARARGLEAGAFVQVGLANIAYCRERGWLDADADVA